MLFMYRNLLLAGDVLVDEGLFVLRKDAPLALFISNDGVDFGAFGVEEISDLLLLF